MLKGQIGNSGRCEFTVSFHERLILCVVEFKHTLPTGAATHSDVIAQVIAEMDGADMFTKLRNMTACLFMLFLPTEPNFEFYFNNFKHWTVHRGIGQLDEGIAFDNQHRISLPSSERAPDYLAKFKTVVEIIFDTFLQAYIVGILSQKAHSLRRERKLDQPNLGTGFRRRLSTRFWDIASAKAYEAIATFRTVR